MSGVDKYLGKEDTLQISVCRWIRLQYPTAWVHHSPNEGKRGYVQQYKIKNMGVSSGFPDLLIFQDKKIIAVELKAGKNKATTNQSMWLEFLNAVGIPAKVCTGIEEAMSFINEQLKTKQ